MMLAYFAAERMRFAAGAVTTFAADAIAATVVVAYASGSLCEHGLLHLFGIGCGHIYHHLHLLALMCAEHSHIAKVQFFGHAIRHASTGAVEIQKDLGQNIEGRHIIIIEDILDSGNTLNYLQSYLMTRKPASITIATLMDKPSRRAAPVYAKYSCFEVPDEFVVGYGLDYDELYRNLPFIGVLKPEIYTK